MKTRYLFIVLALLVFAASASASDFVLDSTHEWDDSDVNVSGQFGVIEQYAPILNSVDPDAESPTSKLVLEWGLYGNYDDTAFRYDIYRCTAAEYYSLAPWLSDWDYIDSVNAGDWDFTDSNLEDATQYYYLIVSVITFYDPVTLVPFDHHLTYSTSIDNNYTMPMAPVNLTVSYPNDTLRLDFDNAGNVQNHELYIVDITADTATPVDLGSATYYVHSSRNTAHSYDYAVRTKHVISGSQTNYSDFSNTAYSDSPSDMDAQILFPYLNENEFATRVTWTKPGSNPAPRVDVVGAQDFSDDFQSHGIFYGFSSPVIIPPTTTLKDGCYYTFKINLYDAYPDGNLIGISNEDTEVTPLFKPTNLDYSRTGTTVNLSWDYSGYRYGQAGFVFELFCVDDLNNVDTITITNGNKYASYQATSGRTYNFAVRARYLYTFPDSDTETMYSYFSNTITGVSIP